MKEFDPRSEKEKLIAAQLILKHVGPADVKEHQKDLMVLDTEGGGGNGGGGGGGGAGGGGGGVGNGIERLYEKVTRPVKPPSPPKSRPKRNSSDWERHRKELEEAKRDAEALRYKR